MELNSSERESAAKLIGKSFSDAELKLLRTNPKFLRALEAVKSLDDAVRVAEFGALLIMKENGIDESPQSF